MEVIAKDLDDTSALAKKIASLVKKGDVITLNGTLGTGKTTFARYFINFFFDNEQEVVSPSFNILQIYCPDNSPEIWHYDLYRLKSSDEMTELGIEEALDKGITLIEWPEKAKELLPESTIDIFFSYSPIENERVLKISAPDDIVKKIRISDE